MRAAVKLAQTFQEIDAGAFLGFRITLAFGVLQDGFERFNGFIGLAFHGQQIHLVVAHFEVFGVRGFGFVEGLARLGEISLFAVNLRHAQQGLGVVRIVVGEFL